MRISDLVAGLTVVFFIASIPAMAGVPEKLTYQGRLLDSSGKPVADGQYLIQFRLYSLATSGSPIWDSRLRQLKVKDGLFSYNLGDSVAISPDIFRKFPDLWLGIRIGTSPELLPRIKLTSSGFALQSLRSDSALTLGGKQASYFTDWGNLVNMPTGFADGNDDTAGSMDWTALTSVPAGFQDGVDNVGSGDITGVVAGSGLTGGGLSGVVTMHVRTGSGLLVAADSIYIAKNSLGAYHLGTGSVGTSEVADNSLNAVDLAPGCVGASEIVNGSISNADISPSAGISTSKISGTAVNLTSVQNITGTKTFDNLKIVSTSRRLTIAPPAFQPLSPGAIQYGYTLTNGLSPTTIGGGFEFSANVSLPDGAVVTQLEGYFYDIDPGDWKLKLVRIAPSTSAVVTQMGVVNPTGVPGYTNAVSNSISSATIDNEQYVYVLHLSGSMAAGNSFFKFFGAEIEYTITRPLP